MWKKNEETGETQQRENKQRSNTWLLKWEISLILCNFLKPKPLKFMASTPD